MTGLSDSFQRPISYLRISVTDRCNLRCVYCMPSQGIDLISHHDILTYEEIYTVARAAAELGVKKIRITGGEPLVRLGLSDLVRILGSIEGIDDISLTTNGILLGRYADGLKSAGLKRVNVSLDTLRPERFERITGSNCLEQVLAGITAARQAGLEPVKLNTVVLGGLNDDEIIDFGRKTINEGWHVRFIERMSFYAEDSSASQFVSANEVRQRLETLGKLEPCSPGAGNGPAKYFRFAGASGSVGFITAVSEHFCFNCNRLRLTADGKLRLCLMSEEEIDLKQPLRQGISQEGLKEIIRQAAARKPASQTTAAGKTPRRRPFSQVGG
ncbi:MAG: GTP 3',8-cyclase MoaA [Chloroflexota bacterium]